MIQAAIDIGTNSTRLLIAKLDQAGQLKPVVTRLKTTRLGDGVDSNSYLKSEAIVRTVEALKEYRQLIDNYRVQEIEVVATSAVRDVDNQDEFSSQVREEAGLEVDIISGQQEAKLSYRGAVKSLEQDLGKTNLVIDIGGGSTEFILGQEDNVIKSESVDVGAVRMIERKDDNSARRELIDSLLTTTISQLPNGIDRLIGVGGTITTLSAIDQQLEPYDPLAVQGSQLQLEKVQSIYTDLSQQSISQRKEVKGLQPARADIIISGVQILLSIMETLEINEIVVSDADILEGLIYKNYNQE
ncbi:MAG: Ppx/GppA phosphatase family protein [Bacillota bacterium]